MDAFILRNSSTTENELKTNKAKIRAESIGNIQREQDGQCTPSQDAFMFYPKTEQMPKRGDIERTTRALLEVDRPPVMNPCL